MNLVVKQIAGRLLPFGLLCLLWGILTQWDLASWLVGLPTALLALVVFDRLWPRRGWRIQPWRIPGFTAWFLWHSLRGGLDVAWRAFRPRMHLNPGLVSYELSVGPGPARVFFVNCVSLLPGTLSAQLAGDDLVLHVLDTGTDILAETHRAEQQVKRLYGIAEGPSHE